MKLYRFVCAVLAAALVGIFGAAGASAQTAVTTTGGTTKTDFSGSVGFNFTVGSQPISITALGYYAPYLPAGTSHQVAIFNDASKTLVGTATTITSTGSTTPGTWIYDSVTPFTLNANTTYDAMASNVSGTGTTTGNASYLVVANSPSYGTDLTFNIMVFTSASNSATVQASNSTFAANNPGAFNANFQYGVVPEPASVGLIGLGAAGLLIRRRHR